MSSKPLEKHVFLVVIQSGKEGLPELGRRYIITKNSLTVGNASGVDVLVNCAKKGDKVEVAFRGRYWQVESKGGGMYMLNTILTHKGNLYDGDILQIGDTSFEFCTSTGVRAEFYQKNEEARLEDVLTKAMNRKAMMRFLEQDMQRYKQWAKERRKHKDPYPPMSLIMLDVDKFGEFNKKYDHLIGDEVLKGVVARILKRVRRTDLVGRYGGEEFLISLPNTDYETAMELAEKVRKIIAASSFDIGPHKNLQVTASLGVAQFEPAMKLEDFIRAASQRVLSAKMQGRNRVVGNKT